MLPTIKLNIERWKYNPTFELYVSNMGHIRNKSKADIAPRVAPSGYLAVKVHGSLNTYMLLHRVVMLTWRPTPEAEGLTVDHLDHNKRNNALSNLEWVVAAENKRRAAADFINAKEVVDHHLVETRFDPKEVTGLLLTVSTSQYPQLEKEYAFPNDINKVLSFLSVNRSAGIPSLQPWGQKAQEKLRYKYRGLMEGTNTTGKISYMGMTITPIINAPAAE